MVVRRRQLELAARSTRARAGPETADHQSLSALTCIGSTISHIAWQIVLNSYAQESRGLARTRVQSIYGLEETCNDPKPLPDTQRKGLRTVYGLAMT